VSRLPSSVGSVPVKPLTYRFLHSHITVALSPHPGDGARVQARWVRVVHAQDVQRSQRAQLCGQCARDKVVV
jgi:hypothetical protein